MRVGSLVECILGFDGDSESKPVIKGRIYTIREICSYLEKNDCVLLEEIQNGLWLSQKEWAYKINRFAEIPCPISISIEEMQHQLV